jgi:hypothetical protein
VLGDFYATFVEGSAESGIGQLLDVEGQSVPEFELFIVGNIFNGNGHSSLYFRSVPSVPKSC